MLSSNKINYSPLSVNSSISSSSIESEKTKNKLLNKSLNNSQQPINNIEKALLKSKTNNNDNINPLTGKLRNKI